MRIAIIGTRGQLGSELVRALPAADVVALNRPMCDVTRPASLESALGARAVDVVIDLASYNRVDESERDPATASAVNAAGAGNAARAAAARDAPVCYVSTDYVFGGDVTRREPYDEDADPAPVTVYGRSKLAGEHRVREANPAHLIVRTSGLFGAVASRKGAVFPQVILERAAAGEPIRVVNDQTTSPTYARDLAARIVELIEAGARGVVHASNSGSCTWYEFACEVLRQAGVSAAATSITSAEYGARARRPAYSVLRSRRLSEFGLTPLRPWQDALGDYLAEIRATG